MVGELTRLIPLVAVLDDAHRAPDHLFAVLEAIVRVPQSRTLVVLSVDGDLMDPGGACQSFIDQMETAGLSRAVNLGRFDDAELAALCVTRGPGEHANAETLGKIVRAADGSPGRLIAAMSHRPVREALAGKEGLDAVRPAWLLTPGYGIEWDSLSDDERTALATLACHGPRTLVGWFGSALLEAAQATGWVDTGDQSSGEIWFRSTTLFAIAATAMTTQLSHGEIRHQVKVVREDLARRAGPDENDWDGISTPTVLALLENLGDNDPEIPDRLRATLMRMRRAAGRDVFGEQLLQSLLSRRVYGELQLATAEAIADAGYAKRAIHLYEEELAHLRRKYDGDSTKTIPPLHNLAGAQAAYAMSLPQDAAGPEWDRSFSLFEELVRAYEREAQTGPRPNFARRTLPDVRRELAEYYFRTGRYWKAHDAVSPSVTEYESLGLPIDALIARGERARYRGNAGDPADAVRELKSVLLDKNSLLGRLHPATLVTRGNLAAFLGELGEWDPALRELEVLLPDIALSEGPDSVGTLAARGNHGHFLGMAGNFAEAEAELDPLLPDCTRVLGADHPETLMVRINLAEIREKVGNRQQSEKEFAALLPILDRVLGLHHPRTVAARRKYDRLIAPVSGVSGE